MAVLSVFLMSAYAFVSFVGGAAPVASLTPSEITISADTLGSKGRYKNGESVMSEWGMADVWNDS